MGVAIDLIEMKCSLLVPTMSAKGILKWKLRETMEALE